MGMRDATRTLLTFLVLLYSVFLGSIAVAGGLIALGAVPSGGPLALSAVPAVAAALAIGIALALATRRPSGEQPAAEGSRARRALHTAPGVLGASVRDAIALVRSGDLRLLGAVAWWTFDAAVLWAMLHALGAPPSLAVVVLAYFLGQVANTIPLPGAVSGGMVGVLLAFGVEADLALAAVLAYRSIAIWLPAPIGLAALGGLRRTITSWGQAAREAPPPPGLAPRPGARRLGGHPAKQASQPHPARHGRRAAAVEHEQHVVAGQRDVRVRRHAHRELAAARLARDPQRHVALVHVDGVRGGATGATSTARVTGRLRRAAFTRKPTVLVPA